MRQVSESTVINAQPDAVWKPAGDPAGIADWVPALEASHVDGDVRHATFAGGGEARERIVEHDDAARYYVYDYLTGPLPLRDFRARIEVREHAEGAEVVWASSFDAGSDDEGAQLAEAISGIYRDGLRELKKRLEA